MKRVFLALLTMVLFLLWILQASAEVVTLPIDLSGGLEPQKSYQVDNHLYEDPSIRVEWTKVKYEDSGYYSSYYYVKIKLANASQLRTASAGKDFTRTTVNKVGLLANRVNAVLALNGDYYAARPVTYVLRQGVLYQDAVRENSDVLLIDEEGDFHILLAEDHPEDVDKTTWEGKKIINAFNFGPALYRNNEMVMNKDSAPYMSEPDDREQRMVIAQIGHLEYMVFTCGNDVGMNLDEICEVLPTLSDNLMAAYMLDGGNSAQLYFMGKKIDSTKNDVNNRKVSDIIYFASAWQEENNQQ